VYHLVLFERSGVDVARLDVARGPILR
jgi:hypothetical protein